VKLYLCEKPSQARDIARVLGIQKKGDGCLQSSGTAVTWCFGHLLEMAPPDAYDEALKRWRFDTLPIAPQSWKLEIKKEARKQYKIIQQLLKQATDVVVATDADREGETIAREILERCRWRGPVSRLWLSALDDASIRKALNNVLPGSKTEPLYHAGLGRSRADWLVGMNLTRAYTLIGQQNGHKGVLSVGRVQTPTLNLIVQRDLSIEQFKPCPYYDVYGEFGVKQGSFKAKWLVPKMEADDEGRCINEQTARTVAQKIEGQQGSIVKADTERKKEPPPLPFDLSSLQQEASKRWGMGAKDVLDTAQALYETHKALTYPRTDCQYLPESQRADGPQVLGALKQSDERYAPMVEHANTNLRSRVWNDKKITAHHAIIPTATPTDISRMSEKEWRIYDLACRRYIAQFYPALEFDKTVIEITVCDELFRTTGKVPRVKGWRAVLKQSKADNQNKQDDENQTLPPVTVDEIAKVLNTSLETKQTKPPARFTEGTLIAAMKSVGKSITDAKLKKILRETSGIGTEATRASIIETLFQRNFIQKQKKQIISTQTGRSLIAILPDEIKAPATTALWEQGLDDIAQGRGDLSTFINGQTQWVTEILRQAKQQAESPSQPFSSSDTKAQHPCPDCGKALRRRKGKNGFFWGCSGYPDCKTTRPDSRGKPGKSSNTKPRAASGTTSATKGNGQVAEIGSPCPQCKSGSLLQRAVKNGKNAGKPFIGCTGYPKCNYFSWPTA